MSAPSESCARCHPDHYDSWHRTYHRTMTREATPEAVKGDFADAAYGYQGVRTRFLRRDGAFYMETAAPSVGEGVTSGTVPSPPHLVTPSPPQSSKDWFRVARTVGSHWVQEYLYQDPTGRYSRLPVLYHIAEHRWVHSNGAFLAPDTPDFWEKCRNTTRSAWARAAS